MKRITFGIIAFFLTFGISTALVGLLFGFPKVSSHRHHAHHSPEALSIEYVLDQDISYGEYRRNSEVRLARSQGLERRLVIPIGSAEHARIVDRYASKASAIDASATPPDFRYAWNRHMKEWAKFSAFTNALANREAEYSGLSDNTAEINETWGQVIRIARRYGVHIKPRYLR